MILLVTEKPNGVILELKKWNDVKVLTIEYPYTRIVPTSLLWSMRPPPTQSECKPRRCSSGNISS